VSTPSRVQEVRTERVGAVCPRISWFPRTPMVSAPYFEVMKDAAAPWKTLAGMRRASSCSANNIGGDHSEGSSHGLTGKEGSLP